MKHLFLGTFLIMFLLNALPAYADFECAGEATDANIPIRTFYGDYGFGKDKNQAMSQAENIALTRCQELSELPFSCRINRAETHCVVRPSPR